MKLQRADTDPTVIKTPQHAIDLSNAIAKEKRAYEVLQPLPPVFRLDRWFLLRPIALGSVVLLLLSIVALKKLQTDDRRGGLTKALIGGLSLGCVALAIWIGPHLEESSVDGHEQRSYMMNFTALAIVPLVLRLLRMILSGEGKLLPSAARWASFAKSSIPSHSRNHAAMVVGDSRLRWCFGLGAQSS